MERSMSTYTVDREGYHLFIKEIPAYICTQCGEKYFDEEEVEAIQKLIQKVEAGIKEAQATIT
jgi:YgiT-type zinc finger domain-containing protein